MPTLTTQSIGIVSAQVTAHTYPAAQARATEVNSQSGVQRRLNQTRAANTATQVQGDKTRSIQEEKRTEGSFADHDEGEGSRHEQPYKGRRFNSVA